jgi:hypothetical protein
MNSETIDTKYAELQSKIQDCITWAKTINDKADGFRDTFKDTINDALQNNKIQPIEELTQSVNDFMNENKIPVSLYNGGRRRNLGIFPPTIAVIRRSSKQRATMRKPKRRQRRASRRVY